MILFQVNKLMKSTFCILMLVFWSLLQAIPIRADVGDTRRVTRLDSLFELVNLDENWLYKKGDDTAWAETTLNDADWDTIRTTMHLDSMNDDLFEGKGWFRLHMEIPQKMFNQTYALLIRQQGASEIYLNGEKIKSNGSFATDTSEEERRNPILVPTLIKFSDTTHQVLAVRYSHENYRHYEKWFYHKQVGFSVSICEFDYGIAQLEYLITSNKFFLGLLMIFFILGLIHLLLYLFYRRKISNLYFSLFMMIFSLMVYTGMQQNAVSTNPDIPTIAAFIVSILVPFLFIMLQGFIYSLMYEKMHRLLKISFLLGLITALTYLLRLSFSNIIILVFAILASFDIIRLLILFLRRKYDGAWIIGTGLLLFVLFFISIFIIGSIIGGISINSSDPYALLILSFIVLTILSPPLSMSIYLARDFARTNLNLEKQLEQVKILSAKTLEQEREKKKILENQKEQLEIQVKERTRELEAEKEKTEELLLNTLPLKVVNDLKENGTTLPESFDEVTVYFSDIVGFTKASTELAPDLLIQELNEIFTAFDDIMVKNHCERIKTIGDAYLAVCGMPDKNEKHAENMLMAAMEIKKFLEDRNGTSDIKWKIRIGIHSGRVVGGVVGVRKYIYDVFGDTINTTSRMESHSEPMRINVSDTTYHLVKDKFKFIAREPMDIKGKGLMRMYFLEEN